jgi:uncharacterized protein YutE (UPF0331/DUF86 family)
MGGLLSFANTLSEHHGKQFLKYLKLKNILLHEYNHKEIYFTVKEVA